VQVPCAIDQHPVGAFGPHRAHPPFGITVRPRHLGRGLDRDHALAGKDFIEGWRERGVTIADQETERIDLVTEGS
jgi:hypothetical protein